MDMPPSPGRRRWPTAAAVMVTALVAGMNALPQWVRPVPKVPIVIRTVVKGQRLQADDVHWVSVSRIDSGHAGRWAAANLLAGEVLTANLETAYPVHSRAVLVEITPTSPAEATVDNWVSQVEVWIVNRGHLIWSSGPRALARPAGSISSNSASSGLAVWLSPRAALGYALNKDRGRVMVLGVGQ